MNKAREIYGSKWSEKEFLIVLYYYFLHKDEPQHAETSFVQELSRIIGRTPHSILYRLQNYSSIDPTENDPKRKGKAHITTFGKQLFEEWSKKPDSLKDTAEAFLRDEKSKMVPDLFNPDPVNIPITFRNYELLDEIGRGAFGIVFSCIDTRNDETYALKIIDASQSHIQEYINRFSREIRALKSISHPNVIKIYEDNLDKERSYPGFVMDLGKHDLPKYLSTIVKMKGDGGQRPVLENNDAVKIFNSIMDAVAALHNSDPPILHRDINPNNILQMFDDTWTLADYSLAKFLPPEPVSTAFVTETHVGMGTGHYAAPEQYNNLKNADVRSDIFSLGWLLWDLFSSEGPYPTKEPSGLPGILERVFLKATSHYPKMRYQNISEFQNEFNQSI